VQGVKTEASVSAKLKRADELERRLQAPLMFATLLVIPVMILQAVDVPDVWTTVGWVGDWIIWLTFLAEVVLMLRVVPDRAAWIRSHPLDVLIVVLTPPVGPAVLQSVRILRLLRLVRLFRLAPLMRSVFTVKGVEYAGFLAFLTIIAGGQTFASVENKSLSDGMYWAISTMTTVGYGDVAPATDEGKLLAAVVMLVGIGFVAVVTGAIAQRFVVSEDTVTEGNKETFRRQEATHQKLDEILSRLDSVEREIASARKG
jgi:voltage-gated potassium channel